MKDWPEIITTTNLIKVSRHELPGAPIEPDAVVNLDDNDPAEGLGPLTNAEARALYLDVFEGIEDFAYWDHPVLDVLQRKLSQWFRQYG